MRMAARARVAQMCARLGQVQYMARLPRIPSLWKGEMQ
jgi:hypothetical protein